MLDQGKAIWLRLCERIEAGQPSDLTTLYGLTRAATEEFNLLDRELVAAGSGIETVAHEWIWDEFRLVSSHRHTGSPTRTRRC